MSDQEIKEEFEFYKTQIEVAESRIKKIQGYCKHPRTKSVIYSYRVGSFDKVYMCEYCGKITDYVYPEIPNTETK